MVGERCAPGRAVLERRGRPSMRMRFVLAVAATVAALVTAGPVTAAVAAPAAATVTAAVAVPPGRVPGTRAAGCVLAAAAHQDAAGATYFSTDPGRRLIVLSPGETASADIS